jgi:adenylate cyclase
MRQGKKCDSSILFADIRGFTAYCESKEPEEIIERLNELFEIITKVVIEHGGHVDKFIGDSVLAVFGVPTAEPGHLKQCISAAIEIQQRLVAASGNGNTLLDAVGIGISSGVVVAGNIGSQAKIEYTVIGDAVNVAAYVNCLAGPGEIIVCCDNEDDLADFSGVMHLPAQKVKKRECLVNLFQIQWTKN